MLPSNSLNIQELKHPLDAPPIIERSMKVSGLSRVQFGQKYPAIPLNSPFIVWRMIRRTKGKGGKETRKPRIRSEYEMDGKMVRDMGQWTTAIFQFDIIATSNEEVNDLMKRWESFMDEMQKVLGLAGADDWIFTQQIEDYSLPIPKEIPSRSLQYELTMSTVQSVLLPRIHQIALSIATNSVNSQTAAVRGATLTDTVTINTHKIYGIGRTEDEIDFILGIDYDLAVSEDENTAVTWLTHGLHPEEGETYYIHHVALVDPKSVMLTE